MLFARNAALLVTMDEARREIAGGALVVRDGWIDAVGSSEMFAVEPGATVLDLTGHIVIPGLVNTHHHLYQTLTRAVPAAQNANLFGWLKTLYPIWARMGPDAVYTSALVGMAELLLSGCTTISDHLYMFPNGARLDDEVRAAQEIGVRFHASRGSMSLGESQGGLPPDRVVEREPAILRDCLRVIEQFHDPKPGSMLRVVVAPCSPFSVSAGLMRESVELARSHGVQLHTHLAETLDEELFCEQKFGHRPVAYAEELGWTGPDVWFAHMVHVSAREIPLLAQAGCGLAHCPSSNMRLASGIAPIMDYRRAGVKVGLGVDGSASNDGNHMLLEARQAMLLARLKLAEDERQAHASGAKSAAAPQMTAREALEIATLGGASVLGRTDIGALAPGMCGDFVAYKLDRLAFAGAQADPLAALLFCAPQQPDVVVVNGRVLVQDGQLTTIDLPPVIERHNRISMEMING